MLCYVYCWFTIFILQILHILIDVRTFSFSRHIPIHAWQSWMDKYKNWFIQVSHILLAQQIILRICVKTKIVKIMWKYEFCENALIDREMNIEDIFSISSWTLLCVACFRIFSRYVPWWFFEGAKKQPFKYDE